MEDKNNNEKVVYVVKEQKYTDPIGVIYKAILVFIIVVTLFVTIRDALKDKPKTETPSNITVKQKSDLSN